MNVLIACEESQTVCKAFREKGHNAYSCDIQPPSGRHPEWHIQANALKLINGRTPFMTSDGKLHHIDGQWDLLIAHPPCTFLSCCANRMHTARSTPIKLINDRTKLRADAIDFFMKFITADCDHICVENPQGVMNTVYRKPDQTIHPYYFAKSTEDVENYVQKRTCLWLKNLPPLERSTDLPVPPPQYIRSDGRRIGWTEGLSGVIDRAKARSKTFPAIAEAMATQWGECVPRRE